MFQSPQWGSNSKDNIELDSVVSAYKFQSPQWGSNSKGLGNATMVPLKPVSVPAMGK